MSEASTITLIPALGDNYIYLIEQEGNATIVDPADARPVLETLQKKGLTLTHILNTHHHFDHVGGNVVVKSATRCTIIGPDDSRIPALDRAVKEGERFAIGNLTFEVLFVPGHTTSHIAYFVPESKWLFSGDALFLAGCGRVFEGTHEQMLNSLQKLRALPKETLVFCGHEYTQKNLQFAAMIEPNNEAVQKRLEETKALREQGKPTVPATLEIERQTNPFLRTDDPALKQALGMEGHSDLEVFSKIRTMKDRF